MLQEMDPKKLLNFFTSRLKQKYIKLAQNIFFSKYILHIILYELFNI